MYNLETQGSQLKLFGIVKGIRSRVHPTNQTTYFLIQSILHPNKCGEGSRGIILFVSRTIILTLYNIFPADVY